jgi:hypothetical protein
MNDPNPMTDLLGRGAEVNCVDNLDRIPLHAAVYGYRQSIRRILTLVFMLLNDFTDLLQSAYLCIVSA